LPRIAGARIIGIMRPRVSLLLFVLVAGCGRTGQPPEVIEPIEARLARTKAQAESAVENYRPASPIDVNDIAADVVPILKRLPFVTNVERSGPAKPTHRIIHLRDWHFVPEDFAKLDSGEPFERQNLRVELVQTEHAAILRCLARHPGLRSVLIEGYTPEMQALMPVRIETLRNMAKIEPKATKEEREEIRLLRLEMGAAACLVASGELTEVLPLDRQKELGEARPVRDGKVIEDPAKYAAREKVMIEMTKAHGPTAVIALGGKHRLEAPGVEVIRVTTAGYPGD
jgi:hypothetical protein